MKKIFLISVCYFALTSPYAFAMEEDQLSIHINKSISEQDLQSYLVKGVNQKEITTEGLKNTINIFNDFVDGLKNVIFTMPSTSAQSIKNKNDELVNLQNNFISFVECFYLAFHNNMMTHAS